MKCKDIYPLLNDYLEGSLSGDEKTKADQHLSECQNCRHALEGLKLTLKMLAQDRTPEPEEQFWTNFLPQVRSRIDLRREPARTLIPKTKLALGFLTILLVAMVSLRLFSVDRRNLADLKSGSSAEITTTETNLSTAADQLAEVLATSADRYSAIGVTLSPKEKQSLDSTSLILTDDYVSQSDLNSIINELTSDELKRLEESVNQIKLSKIL